MFGDMILGNAFIWQVFGMFWVLVSCWNSKCLIGFDVSWKNWRFVGLISKNFLFLDVMRSIFLVLKFLITETIIFGEFSAIARPVVDGDPCDAKCVQAQERCNTAPLHFPRMFPSAYMVITNSHALISKRLKYQNVCNQSSPKSLNVSLSKL